MPLRGSLASNMPASHSGAVLTYRRETLNGETLPAITRYNWGDHGAIRSDRGCADWRCCQLQRFASVESGSRA